MLIFFLIKKRKTNFVITYKQKREIDNINFSLSHKPCSTKFWTVSIELFEYNTYNIVSFSYPFLQLLYMH